MQKTIETFGKIISEKDSEKYYGFIYLIEVSGKKYIGQKSFRKGTNWKNYKSSSKLIKELLKKNVGKFEVLHYARNKSELTYLEVMEQFKRDVLRDTDYLNENILGKFYRNRII